MIFPWSADPLASEKEKLFKNRCSVAWTEKVDREILVRNVCNKRVITNY